MTNYRTISVMKKLDQQGSAGMMLALVTMSVLLVVALGFGAWAYSEQQKYKNDSDAIVAAAVKVAVDKNSTAKDNQFAEAQKSPLKPFNGPSTYGSINLQYPKTWSAYIDQSDGQGTPINAYFNPNFVPGTQSKQAYALRMQVTPTSYDQEIKQFDGLVQQGLVKVKPFNFPNVKGVVGIRVDGQIDQTTKGTVIMVPLRDKAIKLWTESDQFQTDFNKYILPNFKFSP